MKYFDTSFLMPLAIHEPTSASIRTILTRMDPNDCLTSNWAKVELASGISRRLRMKEITLEQANQAKTLLFEFLTNSFSIALPHLLDFELAEQLLTLSQTGLRAGDALHLAIAQNRKVSQVFTLDQIMAQTARNIGLPTYGFEGF